MVSSSSITSLISLVIYPLLDYLKLDSEPQAVINELFLHTQQYA